MFALNAPCWRGASDAGVPNLFRDGPIVELFSETKLSRSLAFRGATALYKLHLRPAARYSEDIDLVQILSEPIGPTLDAIRAQLDPWLGTPRRQLRRRIRRGGPGGQASRPTLAGCQAATRLIRRPLAQVNRTQPGNYYGWT
ncbi:nucleotidyl transferase AbiEii/AbiGii toxin family protein [bacterium]|nr:nucleotidyl transferase AbiEii/AbiGii toxin family protein [bacterium]